MDSFSIYFGMLYNILIGNKIGKYNIFGLTHEKLIKVVDAYLNGINSFTISGTKYSFNNPTQFKIFTHELEKSPEEVSKYYLGNVNFREKFSYSVYLPIDTLRMMGKDVTENFIGDYEFGEQGKNPNLITTNMNNNNPKTFISYAWENDKIKKWVKDLAIKLRDNGIDVKLDQWELVPGDQMPQFMEKSVRENDYVLIVCSPKYKLKSENRIGGVGYEGDIMTAEVLQTSNHRKFIPILQSGTKGTSIPSWLQGKYYIDLSSDYHFENNFEDLRTTLLNIREKAPELGNMTKSVHQTGVSRIVKADDDNPDIRIKGILVDEVTQPLGDGSRGSGLYKIPFELNKRPSNEWNELFVKAWNFPAEFSIMHRTGIASVYGDKIILDGTTIEEVEKYHKRTLKLAVEAANKTYQQIQNTLKQKEEGERRRKEEHKKKMDDISKRISFDD